jgi:hypothetical protein
MASKKRRRKSTAYYSRCLLEIIHQYEIETGQKAMDFNKVTQWAKKKGLWDPPPHDPDKDFARALAKAARSEMILDEDGLPVRRMHSFIQKEKKESSDPSQPPKETQLRLRLWVSMENATREQMHVSARLRWNGMLDDGMQLDRDLRHFNKHFNPGEPIVVDYDMNKDIHERRLPTEYPDVPPPEDEGQEEGGGI